MKLFEHTSGNQFRLVKEVKIINEADYAYHPKLQGFFDATHKADIVYDIEFSNDNGKTWTKQTTTGTTGNDMWLKLHRQVAAGKMDPRYKSGNFEARLVPWKYGDPNRTPISWDVIKKMWDSAPEYKY